MFSFSEQPRAVHHRCVPISKAPKLHREEICIDQSPSPYIPNEEDAGWCIVRLHLLIKFLATTIQLDVLSKILFCAIHLYKFFCWQIPSIQVKSC